ncbi:MAG: hypothetical protein AB3N23_20350 [Paracoccaceae bacterium]
MKTLFWAAATLLVASPALACDKYPLRTDTDIQSNSTVEIPCAGPGQRYSNWPALPERQGGRSYSKIVHTTGGWRERNAESGRR